MKNKLSLPPSLLVALNVILMGVVIAQWTGLAGRAGGGASPAEAVLALSSPNATAHSFLGGAGGVGTGALAPAGAVPNLVEAARRISPSIVSIGAVRTVIERAWARDFFSPFYVPMDYERRQRIPYLGSGVIIDNEGLTITNYHVIEGASDLFVTMGDGREVKASLVDADKVLDVAVLRLEARDTVAAAVGDSSALQPAEWVMAVGNPFGNLIDDPHPTITAGVISALNRSFSPTGDKVYPNMIQTDAAINPGNSGGPLVDAWGRVIGINTFIFTQSGGSEGIGFAIPINRVMRVVREIQQHGKIRSLYADIEVMDITREVARRLGLRSSNGAYVSSIERGGPAARAGIQPGDIILAVDGQACESAQKFWVLYAAHYVGDTVTFTILRNGRTLTVQYTMTEGR